MGVALTIFFHATLLQNMPLIPPHLSRPSLDPGPTEAFVPDPTASRARGESFVQVGATNRDQIRFSGPSWWLQPGQKAQLFSPGWYHQPGLKSTPLVPVGSTTRD